MKNAKQEILQLLQERIIKCAEIYKRDSEKIILKVGYSPKEYQQFLNDLDFSYDNGFGIQELFGTIWFVNGSWAERDEYDGAEEWEIMSLPKIPIELIK